MPINVKKQVITGIQIRSARAALGWTSETLAQESGVGQRTIMRLEQEDGIPQARVATLSVLRSTLESAGIEFIGSPDDAPGIRLRAKA